MAIGFIFLPFQKWMMDIITARVTRPSQIPPSRSIVAASAELLGGPLRAPSAVMVGIAGIVVLLRIIVLPLADKSK